MPRAHSMMKPPQAGTGKPATAYQWRTPTPIPRANFHGKQTHPRNKGPQSATRRNIPAPKLQNEPTRQMAVPQSLLTAPPEAPRTA
jgi:hypothetical protein